MLTQMTLEEAYHLIESGNWLVSNTNYIVIPALCMIVADLAQANRELRLAAQPERER
jgi:hypothetical protein